MSQSNLSGFVSDELDPEHASVFTETRTASEFLRYRIPNDGDSLWFESNSEWLQLVNKGGRLWIEVGEGAA